MNPIQQLEDLLDELKKDKTKKLEIVSPPLDLPFKIGKAYLIRTITMYYTGRVEAIKGKFLILNECAWIADTGRWNEAVSSGSFNEVEPMGDGVILSTDPILDAVEIAYKLPNKVK